MMTTQRGYRYTTRRLKTGYISCTLYGRSFKIPCLPPRGSNFFFACFLMFAPGQLGMAFFFFLDGVKFWWWENWGVQQQALLPTWFASMALLYIKSMVHRLVRFSLFYCAMAFLLFYPLGTERQPLSLAAFFFEYKRGDIGGVWLRDLREWHV